MTTADHVDLAALRQRAEQGDADAQHDLGLLYSASVNGVPKDEPQAMMWFRKAADQGVAEAQYLLGYAHQFDDEGETPVAATRRRLVSGISQDYVEAVAWYRKAAEQGYERAQYYLGYAYYTGQGVPQDYVEAHKWYNLAAARATVDAQKKFAESRDEVANRMTPAQIAEAQKLAREWHAAFEEEEAKRLAREWHAAFEKAVGVRTDSV